MRAERTNECMHFAGTQPSMIERWLSMIVGSAKPGLGIGQTVPLFQRSGSWTCAMDLKTIGWKILLKAAGADLMRSVDKPSGPAARCGLRRAKAEVSCCREGRIPASRSIAQLLKYCTAL